MQKEETPRSHIRKKPVLLATLALVPVLIAAIVAGPGIMGRVRALTNFGDPGNGPGVKAVETFRPLFMYDIINQVGDKLTAANFEDGSQNWLGSSRDNNSALGVRLFGTALPDGAVITSATLELKSARDSKVDLSVDVGIATGMSDSDPADIFGEFRPFELPLGSVVQNLVIDKDWIKDTFVEIDVTEVVKDYFAASPTSRLVTLVFKNAGEEARNARRYFYSNALQEEHSPKLVIEYMVGGSTTSTVTETSTTTSETSSTTSGSSSSTSSTTSSTPSTTTSVPPVQVNNRSEIGMDLATYNRWRSEAASGMYDRECTETEHNPDEWHGLVNEEAGCHYDHQHFDDPNYVNDIFGEPGAWFGQAGKSVSYPWQTFPAESANESNRAYAGQMENERKHEGYSWIVRRDQPCEEGDCITDYRLQVHFDGNMHATVRFHSFSFEGRFCRDKSDASTCGIVRYGGWMDYGRLVTSSRPNDLDCSNGNQNFVAVPADNQFFPIDRPDSRDEVRCHPFLTSLPTNIGARPLAEWWGHAAGETRIQLRSFDPIGNVDPNDPSHFMTFCKETDADCEYNQSMLTAVMAYTEHIHSFADSDDDERTDFKGYFDRWGGDNDSCTTAGLDCIPFEYNDVPMNLDYDNNGHFEEARYKQEICENCEKLDYDIAPPGKQWITWFYAHQDPNHTHDEEAPV